MPYVVRCADLFDLVRKWDVAVSARRERIPNARFDQNSSDFQQLGRSLAQQPRIQWFYYSDNADGIALRLYDREFRKKYPHYYREAPKEDGEEWVIVRGRGLGSPRDTCKQEMLNAFGDSRWSVRQAPTNNPSDRAESISLGTATNDRIAYFEHPYLNNSSGAVMGLPQTSQIVRHDSLTAATQALRQFRQIILYGPPGTGKTRLGRLIALTILASSEGPDASTETAQASLSEEQVRRKLNSLAEQGAFNLIVFHPAYEYEQFVGGIVPRAGVGGLCYEIEPGVFLTMARWVEDQNRPAVLMIDEINRGNLPKLLGELLYALEYRDAKVRLPFEWKGRSDLIVPRDLFIVGTMNSSDRSIGHIDVAVRRRFGLLHVEPDAEIVRASWRDIDTDLGGRLAQLMNRLNNDLAQYDHGGELRVGHAYFLADFSLSNPREQVERKWQHQVNQLLEEYRNVLNLDEEFFGRYPKTLDDALSGSD